MYKVQVIAKKKNNNKTKTKKLKNKTKQKPKQTARLCMSVGKGGVLGQLYRYM